MPLCGWPAAFRTVTAMWPLFASYVPTGGVTTVLETTGLTPLMLAHVTFTLTDK